MTIGEVAKMLGISTQSLRLWEKGNTFPKIERDLLGRRCYSSEDVEAIKSFIIKKHHKE